RRLEQGTGRPAPARMQRAGAGRGAGLPRYAASTARSDVRSPLRQASGGTRKAARRRARRRLMAQVTLVEAINLALKHEMARDAEVVVMGQDVGVDGGVFRATLGLTEKFGRSRVIDTPLAEGLIAGMAVGMAAEGLKPVAEIQFSGFAYTVIDQVLNHAG